MDRSRFRRLGVLLISLMAMLSAGAAPASADGGPLPIADPCGSSATTFSQGYVGYTYLFVAAQPDKVCVQATDPTSTLNEYLVVDIQQPSASGEPPTADSDGSACVANHGTQVFAGTGPEGTIRISEYSQPGVLWVCLEAPGLSERVIVPVLPLVSGVQIGAVVPVPAPAPHAPWPSAPSSSCVDSGGLRLVDTTVSDTGVWVAAPSPSANDVDVCVREQGSKGGVGGVLTISGASLIDWVPIAFDLTPCDTIVSHFDAPVYLHIDRSSGTDPASVCIDTGEIALRVYTKQNAPAVPITWTPDT